MVAIKFDFLRFLIHQKKKNVEIYDQKICFPQK